MNNLSNLYVTTNARFTKEARAHMQACKESAIAALLNDLIQQSDNESEAYVDGLIAASDFLEQFINKYISKMQ